jgi:coproporphyrinogen III oxidase
MTPTKPASVPSHDKLKDAARTWFETLRNQICTAFETIEADAAAQNSPVLPGHEQPACFERKSWNRLNEDGTPGGGGVISLMRGRVFEKVGVNISTVEGTFPPRLCGHHSRRDRKPAFFCNRHQPCCPYVQPAGPCRSL